MKREADWISVPMQYITERSLQEMSDAAQKGRFILGLRHIFTDGEWLHLSFRASEGLTKEQIDATSLELCQDIQNVIKTIKAYI